MEEIPTAGRISALRICLRLGYRSQFGEVRESCRQARNLGQKGKILYIELGAVDTQLPQQDILSPWLQAFSCAGADPTAQVLQSPKSNSHILICSLMHLSVCPQCEHSGSPNQARDGPLKPGSQLVDLLHLCAQRLQLSVQLRLPLKHSGLHHCLKSASDGLNLSKHARLSLDFIKRNAKLTSE